MMHLALTALAATVARLPSSVRPRLGDALGFVAGSVLRIRRRHVVDAIERSGIAAPAAVADAMYRSLGRGIVELLFVSAARGEARSVAVRAVVLDADLLAALDEARARGAVVLFGSHTGNWELAAAAVAESLAAGSARVAVVAKTMSARGIDAFIVKLRRSLGVEVVLPRGALAAAHRRLASGDVLVLPIDQVPDRAEHGLLLPFLGRTALVDRAPATIAYRARASVLVVAARRDGETHRVQLLEAIGAPTEGEASSAWIEHATRGATAALERFVRSSPASWMWLHRRWRRPRPRADLR